MGLITALAAALFPAIAWRGEIVSQNQAVTMVRATDLGSDCAAEITGDATDLDDDNATDWAEPLPPKSVPPSPPRMSKRPKPSRPMAVKIERIADDGKAVSAFDLDRDGPSTDGEAVKQLIALMRDIAEARGIAGKPIRFSQIVAAYAANVEWLSWPPITDNKLGRLLKAGGCKCGTKDDRARGGGRETTYTFPVRRKRAP